MAEDLDDGEFWLPSHFLTDDDILMDFKDPLGPGSGSGSDLDRFSSGSTETESDEDESLAGLTHHMTRCSIHSKGWGLSTSPQSTLCGCVGKEGSSRASPNPAVSPPPPAVTDKSGGATLDLLFKAAGEVARYKLTTEKTTNGTGFFDCSSKLPFCPSPKHFSQPQFPPLNHLTLLRMRQQQQMMKPQYNQLTRDNGNHLLGLGPSAWPPLRAHNQHVHVQQPVFMGQIGPKRESVGTGVFLPRQVPSPVDTRKKPEGNPMKMRSGKGSQSQRRRNSRPPTPNPTEIQLPQEWSY